MRKSAATISSITATGEIADGRLTMETRDDEASLAVRLPEHTPLSEAQPVVTLAINGDDFDADVELTSADVEELVAAMDGDHRE